MLENHPFREPVLPTGTLTFLFTDIEGSTRMWELYPDQTRKAMLRHDALIEGAVGECGGVIVRPRGEGDSRFAVFTRATQAVTAAGAIQRRLADEQWKLPVVVRVRVGLHTGEADLRDGDYYGSAVNRCARLRNAASGGQTLLSQVTSRLVEDELPEALSLRDLGEHRLKDLNRPERIYQLIVAGLQEDFPPLKTQEPPQTNLPVALTSYIGRERELAEVKELVSTRRLVTIAGPGGAGKTRLALQVAPGMLNSFANGIWFVDLAPISDPALLVRQVVSILGIQEAESDPLEQTLLKYLQGKSLLMILDNCEHLLPVISPLANRWLRETSGLKILATSREPLGISGEKAWWIPALSFPGAQEKLDPERLLDYEAVKLFVERALAADSNFKLTAQNAPAVAQICAHLEGMPLAIELAAARVRILSAEEIAARLEDCLVFLVGERTAHQRQQNLRALIDWSYTLLTEKETILFRRLSIFSGGFTLQAAGQVCAGGMIAPGETLDLLTQLVDKSFVMVDTTGDTKRYRFLETIHQYSRERLVDSNELRQLARQHAAYFLNIAEQSYVELRGAKQVYWLPRLEADIDNLRAALDWMAQSKSRSEMLLRMAGSLWRFWKMRGHISEGRSRLAAAIESNPDGAPVILAQALRGAGILASQQGDYTEAIAMHERSLALYREIGNTSGVARALSLLGEIARLQGRYPDSMELYQESLALRYEIGEKQGIAETLGQLGIVARDRGQYLHASEMLEESLKLSRELEDKQMIAMALKNLGLVAYYLCEYPKASRLFEEAVSIYHELMDESGISDAQQNLGNVAKDQGEFLRAAALYRKCLEIKEELGDKYGIAQATASLGEVAFYQGKYTEAEKLTGQSLASFQELEGKRGIVFTLGLQAFIACYQGDLERSHSAAERCLALATEMNAPRPIAYSKEALGLVAYAQGDLAAARDLLTQALEIFEKVSDKRNVAVVWINLARIAYRQGDHDCAMQFLDESLSLSRRLDIRWTVSFVLEIMGLLNRSQGNFTQAGEQFLESLKISAEQDNQQGIANCLGALAGLALLADQPVRAARLFAAAEKMRRSQGVSMGKDDRLELEGYITRLRSQLGTQTIETVWMEGYAISVDEILEDMKDWQASWWAASSTP